MNSAEIIARLRERYSLADGWVVMSEATPPKCSRRFDFLAIQGWQSRGRVAMGFEVKVSRSDWLRELKEVAKAEPLVALCTHWWIVAPPDVVKLEEVPATWGLLIVHAEQMRAVKQATVLSPDPWTQEVWQCIMLRLASRTSAADEEIQLAVRKAREEEREALKRHNARFGNDAADALQKLKKNVADFEELTGLNLDGYSDNAGRELGQLVAHIKKMGGWQVLAAIATAIHGFERAIEVSKEVKASIEKIIPTEATP